MSYDDAYWNNFQMSLDYEGECAYYTNGYLSVDHWDYSDDVLGTGYCVTCNGNVGCSSDGTCDNFMTYPAEVSSESGYQMTSTSSTSNNQQVVETPAMTLTRQAQKSNVQAMNMSSRAGQQPSATTASFFGSATIVAGFAGMVASLALVVSAIYNSRIQRASTAESPPSTELPYYLSRD